VKRGHYEITVEILTDKPKEEPVGNITEMHVRALEKQIMETPEYWLWTHKRWKKKVEKNMEKTN
jgi:KDO2-lipid IV(A) lauroyltransferase